MNVKRVVCASVLAAGIGVAGVSGIGLGMAGADPGPRCGAPNAPGCQPVPGGNDWQNRGIDQGRRDHNPFLYNGQRVAPMPAGNGDGWGFWFLGQWIRL
jgi:hypothetical protein